MICEKCQKIRITNYNPDNENSTYCDWPDKWKCKCKEST